MIYEDIERITFENIPEEISTTFVNKRRDVSRIYIKKRLPHFLIEYMTENPDDVRVRGKVLFDMLIERLIIKHFSSYVKHLGEFDLSLMIKLFSDKYYDIRENYTNHAIPYFAAIDYGH